MKPVQSYSNDLQDHEKYILLRIAEGDEAAFAELFRSYSLHLAPYIESLFNSAFWTEEIIQDVFLKIWTKRKELVNIDNPSAYIYKMAANKALDFMKKKSREIKLQYYLTRLTANENRNFTEEWTDFHFSKQIFAEAISLLPLKRAEVYRLRHEEGLTYDEIKDKLQISKNTVRNHLVAALEHIRSYLLKNGNVE